MKDMRRKEGRRGAWRREKREEETGQNHYYLLKGFPDGSAVIEPARQCRRPGFDLWVRKIPWKREWLPTPIFLSREFHGQRGLAGYSAWGCKESDMTEQLIYYI